MRVDSLLPASSVAVKDAPFAPGAKTRAIDHVPSSATSAAKGPDETVAPGSVTPLKVVTRSSTVSPSSGEVTLIEGGVVSAAAVCVVLGWTVVEGAAVVDGSVDVDVGSSAAVSGVDVVGAKDVVVVGSDALVVAVLLSALDTRRANTAEATRAEAWTSAAGASLTSVTSAASSVPFGENAAKPITATRAMMRSPAYARGIRGLTQLRCARFSFPCENPDSGEGNRADDPSAGSPSSSRTAGYMPRSDRATPIVAIAGRCRGVIQSAAHAGTFPR